MKNRKCILTWKLLFSLNCNKLLIDLFQKKKKKKYFLFYFHKLIIFQKHNVNQMNRKQFENLQKISIQKKNTNVMLTKVINPELVLN